MRQKCGKCGKFIRQAIHTVCVPCEVEKNREHWEGKYSPETNTLLNLTIKQATQPLTDAEEVALAVAKAKLLPLLPPPTQEELNTVQRDLNEWTTPSEWL